VGAIADHLQKDLKAAGKRAGTVEGQSTCDWVLIDAGDVIVHIFRPEVRGFYNLEKMWAPETDDAPQFVG
ncbi:MAG: ribosome silencing factor, partial [Roseibium sp.]|nr:ribosome silencing factor [Roseibium sp.]